MRSNGGIIGSENVPTTDTASGIWGMRQIFNAVSDEIWPTVTLVPTYTLSASSANIDEGDSVTITLNATNVPYNTSVDYTVSGIDSADLSSGSITGSFSLVDGTGSVSFTLAEDVTTEGTETLSLSLDNGGDSISVTVNDTSVSPTYNLSSSASSVDEGDSVTITLSTTNVPDNTDVPYTVYGIDASDLSSGSITGNFNISNGTGSVSFTLAEDVTTEGTETLELDLDNGEDEIFVTVNDTSVSPILLTDTFDGTSVDTSKWTTFGTSFGSITVNNSACEITNTSNTGNLENFIGIRSNDTFGVGTSIIIRAKSTSGRHHSLISFGQDSPDFTPYPHVGDTVGFSWYARAGNLTSTLSWNDENSNSGFEGSITQNLTSYQEFKMERVSANEIKLYRDGVLEYTLTGITFQNNYHVYFANDAFTANNTSTIDEVTVEPI